MNILVQIFCFSQFFAVLHCQFGREFIDQEYRENDETQLNSIIEHCGEEYAYNQLAVIKVDREPNPEFYRNIYKEYRIPVQVLNDINGLNTVNWQSCVIVFLSVKKIRTLFELLDKYLSIPSNIYVIYNFEKYEDDISYEYISSRSALLWKKKFVHKLILSINGRNLLFDPFYPSNSSGNNSVNLFGVLRDLGDTVAPLKSRNLFEGFEIGISIFQYLTVTKENDESWAGLEVKAMNEICQRMNVTPRINEPPEKFGWASNGTITGTLGQLIYHQSDLAFNEFFIKDYGVNDKLETSMYLSMDKICVIVPRRARVPGSLLIVRIFGPFSWALICFGNSLIALTYFGMTSVIFRRSKFWKSSSVMTRIRCFFATWIFLCVYPTKPRTNRLSERLHIAFGLMLGVTIGGCFAGKLASSFSKPAFLKNIETLQEFDESGMEIFTNYPNLVTDVFIDEEKTTLDNLNRKLKLKNLTEIERHLYHEKNAGFLERQHSVLLAENFTTNLHLIPDCPRNYHLAYPIAKGSPFQQRLNSLLGRLLSSGIYQKWFKDLMNQSKAQDDTRAVVIRLHHLLIPFLMLFSGLGIAGMMFYRERKSRKDIAIKK